jgi:hypothetical protein
MTNDKIEVRHKFKKLSTDDPKKMTEEDFAIAWAESCFRWHDHLLTGDNCHYCPDWDYLPIDETCMEFEACTCNWGKKDE